MTEIYNLVNSIAENKLSIFLISTLLGFLLNIFLSLAGFNWLKTLNQRLIYIIFPTDIIFPDRLGKLFKSRNWWLISS